jgi:hypothetical protein
LALGVTMLVGLAPIMVRSGPLVQSDLPLCLCVWMVLWLADRPGEWTWGRVAVMTAAGLAAVLFRIVGVILVPAVLIVSLLRWKELRWKGLAAPLIWIGVLLSGLLVVGVPRLLRRPEWVNATDMTHALLRNGLTYVLATGDGLTRPLPWGMAVDAYQLAAGLPVIIGGWLWLRSAGRRYAMSFVILYSVMLLLLPFSERRYMWVLFPVVIFALLRGIAFLAEKVRLPVPPSAVALACGTAIALGAAITTAVSPAWGSLPTNPQGQELFAALRRMNAERPMRAVFTRAHVMALETGIPTMPLFRAAPDTIEAEFNRQCITHVVVTYTEMEPRLDSLMRVFVESRPDHFQPVFRNAKFVAYRYSALRPDNCPPTIRRSMTAQELRQ